MNSVRFSLWYSFLDEFKLGMQPICTWEPALADPRGAPGTRAPPGGPNSFIFMQFLAKN